MQTKLVHLIVDQPFTSKIRSYCICKQTYFINTSIIYAKLYESCRLQTQKEKKLEDVYINLSVNLLSTTSISKFLSK